ncbi:MAG TPA: polysaccharide deacetylase family protein [Chitinophagaceae bacterium]|nr:polysaccharide deacetylase family protein [Chitinophagaceae bacterium]
MFYLIKTPWWLKKIYPSSLTWNLPVKEKVLYLSFDDGPHATATPFVLDTLKRYNAKATFFCIGKNVIKNKEIYNRIIDEGHKVGNHTFNHLNGWKTNDQEYIHDVIEAAKYIDSKLFRPPYGRINRFKITLLKKAGFKIIMWDVLSGDFDKDVTKEKCVENVIFHAKPGSIIVFHDSEKAMENMSYTLPVILEKLSSMGFMFETISI